MRSERLSERDFSSSFEATVRVLPARVAEAAEKKDH
jgi:hypothetical protein